MNYDLDEVKEQLEDGDAQLFDVREQDEWDAGHLSQASLVTLSGLSSGALPDGVDKSKPTYLHCRSGQRVYRAAPLLESLGFENVIPLNEGFEALLAEGFQVEV